MNSCPKTRKENVVEILHGKEIVDSYRWLEDSDQEEVKKWDKAQNNFTMSYIDKLPQKKWFLDQLNKYAKYDQAGAYRGLRNSDMIFQSKKKKDEDKSVVYFAENRDAEMKVLFNPNDWAEDETLSYYSPTEDGKFVAFGMAKGGDEAPVLKIMDIESGEILPDRVKGWKQYITSWLPDNSGFYYCCNPLKGTVPEGEEFFWGAVYLHKLGTEATEDEKVFSDDEVKEKWLNYFLTYDNKYIIMHKSVFYKNSVWIQKYGTDEVKVITDDFDAEYNPVYYDGKLYILTNKNSPNKKVFVTDAENPGKENWQEFIPETEFKIEDISIINGKIYVSYMKNVHTEIDVFNIAGTYLRSLSLPTIGSASIWGDEERGDIWVWFSSFTYPETIFNYDFEKDKLELFFKPKIDIDTKSMVTEQVWFTSKDKTKIPMFLIYNKGLIKDKKNKVKLYGYGGFTVSLEPSFSVGKAIWLKAGGILAIANLRGGGEFGEKWHQAGMKEKKQNVFDDFIAAAEWLIEKEYTTSENLAVEGGSNGGLLIGAVVTQRPDLMKAALCGVPLLDMIRYHHSSIANIWKEEYGSAEDPEAFEYILKYSPYHNVKENGKFPALLTTTGINDARVDPFHARKFTAAIQEQNSSKNPIYLLVKDSSGHGGGTTQSILFEQWAAEYAFLMDQLGMRPEG